MTVKKALAARFLWKPLPDKRYTLSNLVPFVQFKKREKHPWRIVTSTNFLNSKNGTKSCKASQILGIFPDAAKIAAVSPIDKGTDNKNIVSNFQSVSILSTFSKIYMNLWSCPLLR